MDLYYDLYYSLPLTHYHIPTHPLLKGGKQGEIELNKKGIYYLISVR